MYLMSSEEFYSLYQEVDHEELETFEPLPKPINIDEISEEVDENEKIDPLTI